MDVLQENFGPNDPNFLPLPRFGTRSVSMEFELKWSLVNWVLARCPKIGISAWSWQSDFHTSPWGDLLDMCVYGPCGQGDQVPWS